MILKKQIAAFAPPVVKIGSEGVAGVSMHSMQWSLTEGLLMKQTFMQVRWKSTHKHVSLHAAGARY